MRLDATPRRSAICSLKAVRADIGRMKTVRIGDAAVLVELEEVDALQLAVADPALKRRATVLPSCSSST